MSEEKTQENNQAETHEKRIVDVSERLKDNAEKGVSAKQDLNLMADIMRLLADASGEGPDMEVLGELLTPKQAGEAYFAAFGILCMQVQTTI